MKSMIPLLMAALPLASVAQSQSGGVPSVAIPKTTGVLVIQTAKQGITPQQIQQIMAIMPEEIRATVKLYFEGTIRQWYSRGDGKGVVFLVDAKSEDEARAVMETLPLAKEQLMDHQYVPVGPLMPLRALMGPGAQQGAAGTAIGQPLTESKIIAGKTIAITYSSPKVNGRIGKLFCKDGRIGQDPTYPVWRAGANAATKFHTDADLDLGGLFVPKGDYTLYVDIADPAKWRLVINKQTGQWGLTYNPDQDLGRVSMSMAKPAALIEDLKYTLSEEGGNSSKLTLAWEGVVASVPITVE